MYFINSHLCDWQTDSNAGYGGYGGGGYGGGGYGGGDGGGGYGGGGYGGGGYGGGGGGYGYGGGGAGYGGGGGGYGADGGGGYMTNNAGGGGGSQRQDHRRQDAVQPCTIKQVLEAKHDSPDDQFAVNGIALQQVTLVARLSNVNVQVTMMNMSLDDGSGIIECVHMLPADEDSTREYAMQKRQLLRDGAWARVVGAVSDVGGNRQIEAYRLRAVDDHNEITYHRLDVVKTFLAQTKPRPVKNLPAIPNVGGAGPMDGGMGMGGNVAMQTGDGMNLQPMHRAVYEYAKQRHEAAAAHQGESSISVEEVARDIPMVRTARQAKQVLEALASDGHVYTTLDEDHYAFCQIG